MYSFRPIGQLVALAAVFSGFLSWSVLAQNQEDIFEFIPKGGRTLLQELIDNGLSKDIQTEITGQARDTNGWRAYLRGLQSDSPTVAGLDEYQVNTLASYLSYHMPVDAGAELPKDGRDLALNNCQSCHIITVVITQDRTREAWLGTLHKPSHIVVPLTEAEREELADYLVLNAGIPIDLVPPSLRAGGATY